MLMLVRDSHPENTLSPILVTLSGMLMLVSDSHQLNARSPMLVTLSGMLMLVRDSHLKNADFPMLVTQSGMLMLVSDLQCQYLQPIITQYFIDNKSEIWLLFLIAHSKR